MNNILNKYEDKLKECASYDGMYIHIDDAMSALLSALEEYRYILIFGEMK